MVVAELNADRGQQTVELVTKHPGVTSDQAFYQPTDVTDERQVGAMIEAAIQRYGRLDVLVNNVGAAVRKPFLELSHQEWESMLDLNLTSMFFSAQKAQSYLAASGHGAIVNVASMHAFFTVRGVSAYAAAKGGVVALTRSLALEFAPQIRVNAVAPGLIRTEGWLEAIHYSEEVQAARGAIHPLQRIGEPEDIAGAVAFLASNDAEFITGAVLPVDGGLTAQLYRE